MPPYTAPAEDTLFILRNVLKTEALLRHSAFEHADMDVVEDIVRAAATLAEKVIAPANDAADREGALYANGSVTLPPAMVDAYKTFCEQGWPSLVLPQEFGGQGLPEIAQAALSEFSVGGSLALTMLTTTGRASARVIEAHAPDALKQLYLPRLISGEWSATIVMTEPHAGSDIGQVRTIAIPNGDGTWSISGTKNFISFGDHDATDQIAHIVLARTEGAPAGVRGLSLFLVPKFLPNQDATLGDRNNARVQRIEEKMGIHGSPTCELAFDDARGWLLGEEGRGLQCMFTMINTMRLEVAMEGLGIAGAATGAALRYAQERKQGGDTPIIQHPDVRRMLMTMKSLTGGARMLAYETAFLLDLSRVAQSEGERDNASELTAFMLPICKAVFSDMAVDVSSLAIQVHGGHGYIRDHGVEQLMRDARITPIFEGTNGIQAIDLLTRKLPRDEGHAFQLLVQRIADDLNQFEAVEEISEIRQAVDMGLALWVDASETLMQRQVDNPRDALAGATPYLQLAGRVLMGWSWLRLAGAETDTSLTQEYRVLARFFATDIMADLHTLLAKSLAGSATIDALSDEILARF